MEVPLTSSAACPRPTAATWQCGPQRLALRQRFNANELNAADLILKYDTDCSGALDVRELKALAQDFSQGELVSQADVEYLMKVADSNQDGMVSQSEVLHGLKAWYVLRNFPKAVDTALKELDGCALPSPEALRTVLEKANEGQPVALAEAEEVLIMARQLGASEDHSAALRGAIAEWYLHVERGESSALELGHRSVGAMGQWVMQTANTAMTGEVDVTPELLFVGGCAAVLLGVVMPLMEILIAKAMANSQEYECEHPHMRLTLQNTGCVTLGMSTSVVLSLLGSMYDVPLAKYGCAILGCILLVVLLTMEVFGFYHVNSSTSARCGLALWSICYLVYCFIPFLALLVAFFWLPCLALREFLRARELDRGLVAAARRPPLSRRTRGVAITRLQEAQPWQCGARRLALRQKFNSKEIDAARIIRRYDRDGSGFLERSELEQLLQDYSDDQPIGMEDLDYVMRVSDLDCDGTISKEEVLYGLRVWFAFCNMPEAVGQTFTAHQLHDGPLPSEEQFVAFLSDLNDCQPVSRTDATQVRETVLALGGSEELVTVVQLRRAVATWYLHIARGKTKQADLMSKSFKDLQQRLGNVQEHAKMVYNGEVDYLSMSTLTCAGVALFLVLGMPLLELLVASAFPSSQTCEYPMLSSRLWWTGIFTFLVAVAAAGCVLAAASEGTSPMVRRITYAVTALLVLIWGLMEVFGLLSVLSSTNARCGYVLWTFSHFTYVMMPLLTLLAVCCGIPCLFCVEYADNVSVDDGLGSYHP